MTVFNKVLWIKSLKYWSKPTVHEERMYVIENYRPREGDKTWNAHNYWEYLRTPTWLPIQFPALQRAKANKEAAIRLYEENLYPWQSKFKTNIRRYIKYDFIPAQIISGPFYKKDCRAIEQSTSVRLRRYKKSRKKKSHSHHIIPFYKRQLLKIKGKSKLSKFIRKIDKYISVVPFYFSLIISFSALFLLFFIFLHRYDAITSINYSVSIPYPNYPFTFIFFYSILIFYVVIFFHSILKFFIHIFSEVRSRHIYTAKVEAQSLLGITLFILSETMLFFSFFWAFFHSSLTPGIFIGNCWPPLGIVTLNPWHIPFLNTCILLMSGISVNWFFFTLKRLSYITFKHSAHSKYGNKPLYSLNIIYSSVFKFMFTEFQISELRLTKLHPNSGLFRINYAANFVKCNHLLLAILYNLFYFFAKKIINYCYRTNMGVAFDYFRYAAEPTNRRHVSYLYGGVTVYMTSFFTYTFRILFGYLTFTLSTLFKTFIDVNIYYKHLVFSIIDDIYFLKLYATRSFEDMYLGLILTLYLGLMFLIFQFCEYEFYAGFRLDNIYGTVFYSLTLLHGFHVYIGIFSLTMCFSYFNSFKLNKADLNKGVFTHFWIVFSVWYWHFVDIVWIFLFCTVYIWGS